MPEANIVTDDQVREYVERNIGEFHRKRVERLNELQLKQLLRRKILTSFAQKLSSLCQTS